MLVLQRQKIGECGLSGEVGHGGGRCRLAQCQAGAWRAQAWLPGQVQLVTGEAGLALQQGCGCGLQNEFGALDALVLVALESGRSQQREDRRGWERWGRGREGVRREKPLVTHQLGRGRRCEQQVRLQGPQCVVNTNTRHRIKHSQVPISAQWASRE